ncbi:hypothetical protein LSH36_45g10025 [Paralvinella palmiformis]|uniref:Uncharacterized protein n=1 Tax=Paralvinella palmiformis TaxID=53620 RepID=A0AAD9K6U3_9ANNE|nr:hypothetical protein LSH36_45g10025 [Paralvinella palmiformis]
MKDVTYSSENRIVSNPSVIPILLYEILKAAPTAKSGFNEYLEPVATFSSQDLQYANPDLSGIGYNQPGSFSSNYGNTPVNNGYGKEGYGYGGAESYGYEEPAMMGYQEQPSYSYQPQPSYGYGQQQQPTYSYSQPKPTYSTQKHSYGYKPKVKKVYIPVVVKKKKKKMKIISVQKGFFIPGGTQLYGKYKSLKACEKACAATPNCFAGDYNPWFKKCYIHSNYTACSTLNANKKLVHFKKVPCVFPEAPAGKVMLGVQIFMGVEQKKVKCLTECLKCCASLGKGIPATSNDIQNQICYGIDFDFGTHKCYFHVDNNYPKFHFCPVDGSPPKVPRDAVPNPSVVSILLCPGPYV